MKTSDLTSGLNPEQTKGVQALSGPVLVLAGAGSGKTRVLTHRIASLMANGVPGNQILAVTFTNKAASEMKTRIEELLAQQGDPDPFNQPTLGTFHSVGVRILRQDIERLDIEISRQFVIFDTSDVLSLIKSIIKELQLDDKTFKPKAVAAQISGMKSLLTTPKAYFELRGMTGNQFTDAIAQIYERYERKMRDHNALDFDDLLKRVVELWEAHPDILERYRARWQYVLVDEYQDTNFVQYRLIRLLTDEHQNLYVVGDDHQSIYSFRGADFTNILNFEKDYPNTTVIKLEQNYRSTGNILKNANALIGHNQTGRPKNLWTEDELGEPVFIQEVYDERDEARFICGQLQHLVQDKEISLSQTAVLYRTNAQSRALEEGLMRAQIPYQIVGGTRFFDRREIKDIIAYLRLVFNPRDDVAFNRIVNVPSRKLGAATLEVIGKYSQEYGVSRLEILQHLDDIPELNATKKSVLKQFSQLIKSFQGEIKAKPISIVMQDLIEKIDFFVWLDDGTGEGEARIENVKELFSVAGRYDHADDSLATFLEGVALISDLDQMENQTSVTLMTIHAAKGLEFDHVFLPGWEAGMFPGTASQFDAHQLEEERRLAYVAITRARKKCTISFAKQRMLYGQRQFGAPSIFLGELDKSAVETNGFSAKPRLPETRQSRERNFDHELISSPPATREEAVFGTKENQTDLGTGDQVTHPEWGEGLVLLVNGDVASINFKSVGLKKVVVSVTPLEK